MMTMIPLIIKPFQFLQEDYNRAPAPRLLKEIQEAKKHIPQLQEQLSKATGSAQVIGIGRLMVWIRAVLAGNAV